MKQLHSQSLSLLLILIEVLGFVEEILITLHFLHNQLLFLYQNHLQVLINQLQYIDCILSMEGIFRPFAKLWSLPYLFGGSKQANVLGSRQIQAQGLQPYQGQELQQTQVEGLVKQIHESHLKITELLQQIQESYDIDIVTRLITNLTANLTELISFKKKLDVNKPSQKLKSIKQQFIKFLKIINYEKISDKLKNFQSNPLIQNIQKKKLQQQIDILKRQLKKDILDPDQSLEVQYSPMKKVGKDGRPDNNDKLPVHPFVIVAAIVVVGVGIWKLR